MVRLRVVVYNVHGFRSGVADVAGVVRALEPDLLLLNETGGRLALRRLSRALRMELARDPWSPLRRRIKNAVLARPPWRIVGHRLHRFGDVRRPLNPRGALVAHLGRSGRRLWVLAIHLGLHPLERLHAAEELADLARGLDGPILIGGDCNELPDGRAVSFLADRFWDVWPSQGGETFPADDPSSRIDYLFVSEELRVERVEVPRGEDVRSASDHLPLAADLAVAEPGDGARGSR